MDLWVSETKSQLMHIESGISFSIVSLKNDEKQKKEKNVFFPNVSESKP